MKKITAVALGINLVLLFGMYFWTYQLTPRMAFIDVGTVFAKFQLTEDMNAKASKSKEARQNVLDVMAQKAKLFSAKIQLLKDEQEIEQRKLEFLLMEEEYFKNSSNSRTIMTMKWHCITTKFEINSISMWRNIEMRRAMIISWEALAVAMSWRRPLMRT